MRTLTFALTFVTAGPLSAGVAPVLPRLPDGVVAQLRPAAKDAPPAAEETRAAIAERIVAQGKAVGDRLEDKDSGVFTQKTQRGILDDIDKLLKPPPMDGDAEMPPPPPDGTPPPMGGEAGGMPPPMGGSKPTGGQGESPSPRGQARKEQRDREAGKEPGETGPPTPMPGGKEPGGPGGKQPGGTGGKTPGDQGEGPGQPMSKPALPPDDAATKQVWGHLPDRLRQEMNQYYKEQFMPKYNDMLRQYYNRLAEADKRPRK